MINKTVYIGGVARSGTSWIGQIFNSCPRVRFRFQPLFSYEFRGMITEDSSFEEYQQFCEQLFITDTAFLTQKDKVESGLYPDFEKINTDILVFKENRFQSVIEPILRKLDSLCFVGVIRNPNAMLYSWMQNSKEFPEGSDIFKEWRFANCKNHGNEDYFGYYKWKEVANLYLDLQIKYPKRVALIHYDKFVESPLKFTEQLFDKLDMPFTEQTRRFISTSTTTDHSNYYSVFKGKDTKQKWMGKFPISITKEIEADLLGTRLEEFLY